MKTSSFPQFPRFLFNFLLTIAILAIASTLQVKTQSLPNDPKQICTVTTDLAPLFSTWFANGTITKNGFVRPANSLAFREFRDAPNCSFYQWSEQMFLWLTSPAPAAYGGGSHVFNSPIFYGVSQPDAFGNRTLIKQESGVLPVSAVRDAQVGFHGLSVVMDKQHTLFELVPVVLAKSGRPLMQNEAGESIELARITSGKNGQPIFFDPDGKEIIHPRPIIPPHMMKHPVVQGFSDADSRTTIFLDPSGRAVEIEQGQSGNGVLQAKNGSLVYYTLAVNDVYALFLTGIKRGAISSPGGDLNNARFPTTADELRAITDYAAAHGINIPERNALAIELKMAWIEAADLQDPGSYITMEAIVPTYDRSDPDRWVRDGQRVVKLALVGMHVVGSTAGHPEMIWATFEHFGNSPNASYTYTGEKGRLIPVPAQKKEGRWLFSETGDPRPFNQKHMEASSPNILAVAPFSISPSNTMRVHPFGANPTNAASNAEVISINNDVIGSLAAGDVRKNYMMIGATWTIRGEDPMVGVQAGTTFLSNTTMETYQQGGNCLGCHASNKVRVSHVFCAPEGEGCVRGLRPLF